MAQAALRLDQNAPGNFFVDSTCIDCDACRQIAPTVFSETGDQSIVFHQPETGVELLAAQKALLSCPTASIGDLGKRDMTAALSSYPELVKDDVYRCGFTSESSFGAFSYLIRAKTGNVLVDSPSFAHDLFARPLMHTIQLVISYGLVTVLFALIFQYLPDLDSKWRDVWLGAAFTAFLFVIGKFALGLYLGKAAVGSSFGATGSLVVILIWVYYSAQILFFGAEFTQVSARAYGSLKGDESKAKARATGAREPAAPANSPRGVQRVSSSERSSGESRRRSSP